MSPWGRREKDDDQVAAAEAQDALAASVDTLRDAHRQAQQSIKAAADRYKTTEREHGRRVEAAERDLAKASENGKLIGVGGMLGNKAVLRQTTIKVPEGEFPLDPAIEATVDTAGNLATKSRSTVTRMGTGGLLLGPIGLVAGAAARKSSDVDARELYLLIAGPGWASTIKLNADTDGKVARQFAQTVMVRARQIEEITAGREAAIDAARRRLDAERADRDAVLAAHRQLVDATEKAEEALRSPRALVQTNLDAFDPETKPARKARETLAKAILPAPPPLPVLALAEETAKQDSAPAPPAPAPIGELIGRLGRMDRLGAGKALDRLAGLLEPDEQPLAVVCAQVGNENGAVVVSDRRVLWAGSKSEHQVRREQITAVQGRAAFTGGKVSITASEGTGLRLSNLVPVDRTQEIIEMIAPPTASPEPLVHPASDESAAATLSGDSFFSAMQSGDPLRAAPVAAGDDDVFEQIRKLAELKDAGVLTEQEFETKKTELLARL